MKKLWLFLLLRFSFLGFSQTDGTLSGSISCDGQAVKQAVVSIGSHKTQTDSLGHYSFTNVAAGSYRLSASTDMSGYQIGWESAW